MPNMNDCKICGNLVRDPEIKTTSSGKAVATMTVAVNRYFVNQNGEKQEFTDYVRVKAWSPWAEAIGNQLQKGMPVFVEGRYSSYSYGKDGDKKYMTEIVAEFVACPLNIKKPQGTGSGNFEQFGTAQSELPPQMMIYRFKGEEKWIQLLM